MANDFAGDNFLVYSTWAWLEAQVKTGDSPVYRYLFAPPSPGDPFHPVSAGVSTLMRLSTSSATWTAQGSELPPEDYKLSDLMQTFWTNFARDRRPEWCRCTALAGL